MSEAIDARRSAPAALRNRDPILQVLTRALPVRGMVLEIASGSGEHAACFAARLPHPIGQPSDPSSEARASIAAWLAEAGTANMRAPIDIDAARSPWPVDCTDAIVAINMVHISPWAATVGLMANAGRILPVGGVLYLYGPYRETDAPFAASNAAFDEDLRRRDPQWGIRAVDDVAAEAQANKLALDEIIAMPAKNLSLIFRRQP